MSKEKETTIVKRRLRSLLTKKNLVIVIIAAFFLVQYIQLQSVFGTFSFLQGRDSSLITEIGQVKDSYVQFGNDLNEVRNFLRMPKKTYAVIEEPKNTGEETDQNKNQVQLALFEYVNFLSSQKNLEKNIAASKSYLAGLVESKEFLAFLKEQELVISPLSEDEIAASLSINDKNDDNIIFYYLSKEDGKLFLKTPTSKEELKVASAEELQKNLISLITAKKDILIKAVASIKEKETQISTAINSKETQAEITNLKITLTDKFTEKDLKITYSILNKTGEIIGEIVLDPVTLEIILVDKKDSSMSVKPTDISTALVPYLKKLDTKSFIEKKADDAFSELKATLEDTGFNMLMTDAGLSIAKEPREDEDRIYYDILDKDGKAVSSIVVEKATGVINIVDPNGANSQNLLFFDPEVKKKNLAIPDVIPEFSDDLSHKDNTFNILIAGKHGSLVDTMIFAHINEDTGSVRMISIPRDLYYNGRKINAFAFFYGMPELKKVLSDITGYELDKYILIDMYAFIDVIDLIGGVDVHLDSSVIDPTYRTVDNGVAGTLHYEPGDYHLGGKEALRLARTRHTSSDFARAARQQMILEAIQKKAQNFGFGDADTIYEIAKTVISKTETDISIDEALAYYFRYQNYKIESNNVMSSGNVLYVPPYITTENCDRLIAEAAAAGKPRPGCENENHAYTLIPRNDNWNIVKWFFRENFEAIGA